MTGALPRLAHKAPPESACHAGYGRIDQTFSSNLYLSCSSLSGLNDKTLFCSAKFWMSKMFENHLNAMLREVA